MKKLNLISFLSIFILFISCGYTPLYKGVKNINFSISISEINGDRAINNLIKSKLINYKSNDLKINYDLNIKTEYFKNIIAKDTTGAATEYKLIVKSTIKLNSLIDKKEFNFQESFNMKAMNDKLEEQDYEKNIKSNLVNIIIRKLILQLSRMR
jgi:hypothetical protein